MESLHSLAGQWLTGAIASIASATIIILIRRSLNRFDKHIERIYSKQNEMGIDIAKCTTRLEGLAHLVDKMNSQGCNWCRNRRGED